MSASVFPVPLSGIQETLIDAKGDLIVGSAADAPIRLAVGSNNQVLTADSSVTGGIKWATPAGGGKVLQVVYSSYSTMSTNSSGSTWADTGLTASITPSATTSKVLVIVGQALAPTANPGSEINAQCQLLRGSTSLWSAARALSLITVSNAPQFINAPIAINYLDSPNTTSSTTYKTQHRCGGGASDSRAQWDSQVTSTMVLLEIGA